MNRFTMGLVLVIVSVPSYGLAMPSDLITHSAPPSTDVSERPAPTLDDIAETVEEAKIRIIQAGSQTDSTVEQRLNLLEEMTRFEFGRFLVHNRGINGAWTQYMVLHPKNGGISRKSSNGEPLTPREQWLLESAPSILATQERFTIFQREIQKRLHSKMRLGSIPCGLMDDLLGLDYSGVSEVRLTGIDLDAHSLAAAKRNAEKHRFDQSVEFLQSNAWDLGDIEKLDLITSNGLNIYEREDSKVVQLYQEFYRVLKPGGVLVTSFLTPPKTGSSPKWILSPEGWANAAVQKIIFSDILNVKWQAFRSPETTVVQLREAGFDRIEIVFDSANIFPTVIAEK